MLGFLLGLVMIHSTTTIIYNEPVKVVDALEAPFIETVFAKEPEVATSTDIHERIKYYSEKYNLNPKLTDAIIRCESTYKIDAHNASSTAQGYWQFVNKTWYGTMEAMGLPTTTSKFDENISLEAGFFLLKKEGESHWLSSKPCWSKLI